MLPLAVDTPLLPSSAGGPGSCTHYPDLPAIVMTPGQVSTLQGKSLSVPSIEISKIYIQ
jgi:hypothetical protein